MQKFMVMYMAPAAMMAEWMKKPESERKEAEQKMMADWQTWMKEHAAMIKETSATGKNKRANKEGVQDVANDLMLYSVMEAESQDALVQLMSQHPHLGIPGAWIDVMPVRPM